MTVADPDYVCRFSPSTIVRLILKHHGNWHFRLTMRDIVFDNGALKDDPLKAGQVIAALLLDMGLDLDRNIWTNTPDRLPPHLQALLDVHKSVWSRIVQSSPEGVQNRFAGSIRDYLEGSMRQVYCRSQNQRPTFEETLDMRRGSAGVSPLFALAE